jgi:hypothetical protein
MWWHASAPNIVARKSFVLSLDIDDFDFASRVIESNAISAIKNRLLHN